MYLTPRFLSLLATVTLLPCLTLGGGGGGKGPYGGGSVPYPPLQPVPSYPIQDVYRPPQVYPGNNNYNNKLQPQPKKGVLPTIDTKNPIYRPDIKQPIRTIVDTKNPIYRPDYKPDYKQPIRNIPKQQGGFNQQGPVFGQPQIIQQPNQGYNYPLQLPKQTIVQPNKGLITRGPIGGGFKQPQQPYPQQQHTINTWGNKGGGGGGGMVGGGGFSKKVGGGYPRNAAGATQSGMLSVAFGIITALLASQKWLL